MQRNNIERFQAELGPKSKAYTDVIHHLNYLWKIVESIPDKYTADYAFEVLDMYLFLNTLEKHTDEIADEEILIDYLKRLLAVRWDFIKDNRYSYVKSEGILNQFCIAISKFIASLTNDSFMKILMPTLIDTKDYIGMYDDLENIDFDLFVLNSDKTFGLPLVMLNTYCNFDEPIHLYNPYIQTKNPHEALLKEEDFVLLTEYSSETNNLIADYKRYQLLKKEGVNLGALLWKLVDGLREGGKSNLGRDNEAHITSNFAVLEFSKFLDENSDIKPFLFSLKTDDGFRSVTFEKIWKILIKEDKTSLDCVEVNSDYIARIINHNRHLLFSDIGPIENSFKESLRQFNACLNRESAFHRTTPDNMAAEMENLCKVLDSKVNDGVLNINIPFFKEYNQLTRILIITALSLKLNNLVRFYIASGQFRHQILDKNGSSLVTLAVKHKNIEMLPLLLKNNSNLMTINSEGYTPLHYAVVNKQLDTVEFLVNNGASPTADATDLSPLSLAVSLGYSDIVVFFLSRVGIDFYTPQNPPALHVATKYSQYNLIKLLLNACADINFIHSYSGAPIHIAVRHDKPRILRLLLENKADPNLVFRNLTPLLYALAEGNITCANVLLEFGASYQGVNIKECDLSRIPFFNEPVNKDNIKHQLDELSTKFRNHINLEELQNALWSKLTLVLDGKPKNEIQQILKLVKKHRIFHFNLHAFEFFSWKSKVSILIKEYADQFKKTVKLNNAS